MKTKVYKYDKYGQKVIQKHFDLVEFGDNMFGYHYDINDGYGNIKNYVDIFFKYVNDDKVVYIWHSTFSKKTFEEVILIEDEIKEFQHQKDNKFALRVGFIPLIVIKGLEILEDSRLKEAIQIRADYIKLREEKDNKRYEKRQKEIAKEKEEKQIEQEKILEDAETNFKIGKNISTTSFVKLCRKYNVDIHPRTIGCITKNTYNSVKFTVDKMTAFGQKGICTRSLYNSCANLFSILNNKE